MPAEVTEDLVPIMILTDDKDAERVRSMLEGAGIEVCIDSLSLSGKNFPASVMVQKSRIDEAVALLAGFKPNGGVVLW